VTAQTGPSEQQFLQGFPKGAKIVHRQFYKGVFRVDESDSNGNIRCHASCKLEHFAYEVFTIGIPREPVDFLNHAVRAGHPRPIAIHLPDAVKDVLAENFSGSEYKLAKDRASFLWKWGNRAKELAEDERRLHESMPEHLRHLLRGKRLLLLKVCGQPVGSSLLLVLVRNVFRAAVVSPCCVGLLLGDHSKCLCACNKQNWFFWSAVSLRASIWRQLQLGIPTSCRSISILTGLSSLDDFRTTTLLYEFHNGNDSMSHHDIWLSRDGWRVASILLDRGCSYMGARARGRVAVSAPLALRPVPVASAQIGIRDFLVFSSGFISACILIWWLLFGVVHVD